MFSPFGRQDLNAGLLYSVFHWLVDKSTMSWWTKILVVHSTAFRSIVPNGRFARLVTNVRKSTPLRSLWSPSRHRVMKHQIHYLNGCLHEGDILLNEWSNEMEWQESFLHIPILPVCLEVWKAMKECFHVVKWDVMCIIEILFHASWWTTLPKLLDTSVNPQNQSYL
jgi:hypothetical protein